MEARAANPTGQGEGPRVIRCSVSAEVARDGRSCSRLFSSFSEYAVAVTDVLMENEMPGFLQE